MRITIMCDHDAGELRHFWRSTGFSPAELLLTPDMQQTIAYIGSVPHRGIEYVRIHYLLELVRIKSVQECYPECDWSTLDKALDVLVRNGCRPFFELMGNPNTLFSNFNDHGELLLWRNLISALVQHLIERYGQNEVENWYFESWNEPDAHWWPQWPADEQSFCNYYDACVEGLHAINPRLRLGGPGTCRTLSPLFKAFLAHCDSGTNYFTGESGVRLDFISIHEKGMRAHKEDLNPRTGALWRREADIIRYIREHHPRFAHTPFMNNECDPQVGWGDIHTWHARPYYAAIACKIIAQHLYGLVDSLGCRYELLSNDNGFLGRWGNRTLLARFGPVRAFDDGQSHHKPHIVTASGEVEFPPFELIKKPILNAMVMLSLLGNRRCQVDPSPEPDAEIGVIASRRGDEQIAALVYHSRDEIMSSGYKRLSLHFSGLPFQEAMLAHYRIDNRHGDPFTVWEASGAPDMPSPDVYELMRCNQELATLHPPRPITAHHGELDVTFSLPLPGLSLIVLSAPLSASLERVERLWLERYEGLIGREETMVRWAGIPSRVLRTYEVLAAPSPEGPYQRINEPDLLCTAFLDVTERSSDQRYYRVRAVDYWGHTSALSDPVSRDDARIIGRSYVP